MTEIFMMLMTMLMRPGDFAKVCRIAPCPLVVPCTLATQFKINTNW